MLVDNLLDDGTHAVATVADASFLNLLMDIGNLDVLQVGHSGNLLLDTEHLQQGTVYGGEDDAALQGGTHKGAVGEVLRHFGIARHHDVAMQHLALLPRVLQRSHRIAIVAHHGEPLGILEGDSVATILQTCRLAATG